MLPRLIPLLALPFLGLAAEADNPPACPTDKKPPVFILAGDSTTAIQAKNGGGWGTGFLSFLHRPAKGFNHGRNGATTKWYLYHEWATVVRQIKEYKDKATVYVTIQFGHNDQKKEHNISLEEYKANLMRLVDEAKRAGATPILITPLTRREFTKDKLSLSLRNEREKTIEAGQTKGVRVLDLNLASSEYVEAVGPTVAHGWDASKGDNTHINEKGSIVFGRMVADLLLGHEAHVQKRDSTNEPRRDPSECLAPWFEKDPKLSDAIWGGKPA